VRWNEIGTFCFCQRCGILIGVKRRPSFFIPKTRGTTQKLVYELTAQILCRSRVLDGLILKTHGLLNGFQLTLGNKLGALADRFREWFFRD
jgi:hypothetical protein